jgi:hypothetical protein
VAATTAQEAASKRTAPSESKEKRAMQEREANRHMDGLEKILL